MSLFADLRKKATDAVNQALDDHPEFKQRAVKAAGDLQVLGQKAADELNKKAPAIKEALSVGAQKAVEVGQRAAEKAAVALPPALEQLKGTLANVQAKVSAKSQPEQK
jgi:hypothetical protein